jgi:hypothetical protein
MAELKRTEIPQILSALKVIPISLNYCPLALAKIIHVGVDLNPNS